MAVQLTSTTASSGTNGNGTSVAFTGFAVSGTNPVIMIVVGMDNSRNISSVVLSAGLTGGTPVECINVDSGDFARVVIYAIPAPSGTGTITINFTLASDYQAHVLLFANAHQTTPCPTGAGNAEGLSGTGTPKSITLANLAAGEAAVGVGANVTAGDAPTFTGTAETYNDNSTSVNMAAGYRLGAGAVSVNWGSDTSRKAFAAARIVAAPAAGGSVGPLIGGMLTEPHLIKGRLAL